ncbi:hypothetical protein ACTFIU_011148 [Dictyostelium citrinum]
MGALWDLNEVPNTWGLAMNIGTTVIRHTFRREQRDFSGSVAKLVVELSLILIRHLNNKNLPLMAKQGYYMVKLDIKKASLHVLVDPHYRDLFRFVWKGVHYRWKTMSLGFVDGSSYHYNAVKTSAPKFERTQRSISPIRTTMFLKNQTDVAHDPFITRIMTVIHKLRPSSAKYNEIWNANLVFRYLANQDPTWLNGLSNALKVTADSIKGPVINAKEQRNTKIADISILELTSLEASNLSVCPVRHLATYLRSSSKKRNSKSGDSVFIHADGTPLEVDDINKVVISTLSKSGIDISKFKSHSTHSAMASLLVVSIPQDTVSRTCIARTSILQIWVEVISVF